MSSLKLKHSGGNGVIIAAPSSNPAADRTLTVPSNADGEILTTTSPKTGSIIQVVNTTVNDESTVSCISAWADSSITCAITPSATSSKILLSLSVSGEGNATNQRRFTHRIKKVISGGATTYIAGSATNRVGTLGVTGDLTDNATTTASSFSLANYLDSPSTTSAVTYTLQITYDSAGGSGTYYVNRNATDSSGGPRFVSWITLMEVAG